MKIQSRPPEIQSVEADRNQLETALRFAVSTHAVSIESMYEIAYGVCAAFKILGVIIDYQAFHSSMSRYGLAVQVRFIDRDTMTYYL